MQCKETKLNFNGQDFYVGIDVHHKQWRVTILGQEYEHKSMSQEPASQVLFSYLNRHFPQGIYHAVYEAGFCGFDICRELRAFGIDCKVVHAADVPTSEKEKQQKTDRSDSRKLARLLRDKAFEGIDIPNRAVESYRALNRQRFCLVKDMSRVKHRLKSLLFQFGVTIPARFDGSSSRNWSKPYLDWLDNLPVEEEALRKTLDNYLFEGKSLRQQVLQANRQLRELAHTDYFKENMELLISIPGIGLVTAITILTELYDIDRFSTLDQLCNFVGLVPSMHNSGENERTGKMIKRGRKMIKIMLIEASWDALRADPALMQKFNELTKRMNKNKAIIRIARKLLSRIRHTLQNREKYQLGIVC
jgi:transposase